jgi:uncharacterized protein (DUF58 family)
VFDKPRKLSKAPHATPIRKRPSIDISVTGLVYCTTMMLMGLAATNGQANLLFGIFGLMIGVLLVSVVICGLVVARLKVTRTLPEYCIVGRPTALVYHFKNQKRFWPSLSVTLSEMDGVEAFETQPMAYLLHAAAGLSASVPVDLVPKRRGRYELGRFQLSTSFPFGFIKRAVLRRESDSLLVCPALGRVSPQLLAMCRSDQRADAPIKPRRGGQDEFYGVKEHRQGENPRWIYWRRSARTPGVLVAKEMTQVAPPRLMLLVDTFISQLTTADQTAIEKTLAMAASLASQALDVGLEVGLCAWDGHDFVALPPQHGKRHRRDLLAMLARLPSNTTAGCQALLDAAESTVNEMTTSVLLSPAAMAQSLADRLGGSLLVVPALSPLADAWFTFDPSTDFSRCIPVESAPSQSVRQKRKTVEAGV